jgi:hypothetical protein
MSSQVNGSSGLVRCCPQCTTVRHSIGHASDLLLRRSSQRLVILPIPECEPGSRSKSVVSGSFWHAAGTLAGQGRSRCTSVRNNVRSVQSWRMTLEGNEPLDARRILASWLRAGLITGTILGGTYGAAYAAVATRYLNWFIPIGFAIGCVTGFFAGLLAGAINGAVISALTGPFALRRGNPLARRMRAALVAVTTTEAALLPIQLTLGHGVPVADIALLTSPILAAALCFATAIAPARYRDNPWRPGGTSDGFCQEAA